MGAELRFLGSLILVLSNCFLFQLSQFHFLCLVVSRRELGNNCLPAVVNLNSGFCDAGQPLRFLIAGKFLFSSYSHGQEHTLCKTVKCQQISSEHA